MAVKKKKPAKKAVKSKAKASPKKKAVKKTAAKKPTAKKASVKVVKSKSTPKAKAKTSSSAKVKKVKPVRVKNKSVSDKTRYSDKELQEFKSLIAERLESSRKELKYLHEQINRTAEVGSDDSNKYSGLEDGTGTSEKEYLSQMASRQITYIDHLEKALIRIANKTYGICRVTGKLISKERLRAVPHATLSIEAKKAQASAS